MKLNYIVTWLSNNWKFISLIAVAVLLFLNLQQCDDKQRLKEEKESVNEFLNDSIDYYRNKLGQEVAQKKALQGDKSTLQVLLSKEIDKNGQLKSLAASFRKIDAAGIIRTETVFDTIEIPFEVPVETPFSRDWFKDTEYYFVSGTTTEKGNTIHSLRTSTDIAFALGDKKTGLFNSEYRFEASADNPNVKITGLDGYTYKDSKGLLSVDAQAGYGATIYGLTPYAGIGIGFDLWEFLKSLFRF